MLNRKLYLVCLLLANFITIIICADHLPLENNLIKAQGINVLDDFDRSLEQHPDFKAINEKAVPYFDETVDKLPEGCLRHFLPKNCAEATECTGRSGRYKLQINGKELFVECDAKTDHGDWIVIQRRQDGSLNFYRDWADYKKGFGNAEGEFFIGLDNLYALTNNDGPQELLIIMEDYNLTRAYVKYDNFAISSENELYTLKKLGTFSGTTGDSLHVHLNMRWSTRDRDNDNDNRNCAVAFRGAWWYNSCHESNLNGQYGDKTFGVGINWKSYRGHNYSLKHVKMMIRRRRG